jgi:hypothetical protein
VAFDGSYLDPSELVILHERARCPEEGILVLQQTEYENCQVEKWLSKLDTRKQKVNFG